MRYFKRLLLVFGVTFCLVAGSLLTSASAEARTYRSHRHCYYSHGVRHCYSHRHRYRGRHQHNYRAHHRHYRHGHSHRRYYRYYRHRYYYQRPGWNSKR